MLMCGVAWQIEELGERAARAEALRDAAAAAATAAQARPWTPSESLAGLSLFTKPETAGA